MSRCEHNEKITKFCLATSCNHPTSGGCQFCFKKYHCHIGQTKSIKQIEIVDMIKEMTAFQNKKIKFRPFKEAIYNYFNIVKGQLSTYLDCMSSDLLNKVSYSYIAKEGYLSTFKKMKHKEYNKLTTQEMAKIVNFKNENNPQKMQKNEIAEYLKQSQYAFSKINEINVLFQKFQQVMSDIYVSDTVMSVDIFYKKIDQIYANIATEIPKNEKVPKYNNQKVSSEGSKSTQANHNNLNFLESYKNEQKPKQSKKQATQSLPVVEKKPSNPITQNSIRKRRISIDSKCGELFGKLPKNKTYEQKQQEIQDRKRKLQQMMSSSDKKGSKESDGVNKNSTHSDSGRNESATSSGENLFDVFAKQGLNIPEVLIAHTLLPQAFQQKKLYEQNQVVQKRTMKVPVNVIEQNIEDEECQSPILRLKKSIISKKQGGGFQLGLKKVSNQGSGTGQSEVTQQSEVFKSDKQNQSQKSQRSADTSLVNIDEDEANSLYLLTQSFKLSANKAIPLLQAALKYAPHNFSASQYLSFLYLEQNKPKQCLRVCNDAIQQVAGQADVVQIAFHLFNNKAAALNSLGRFSQSIPILDKCLEVKKKDILYKNLGDAYYSLGIIQKAIVNYQNAVILNDQNHQAYYNLAVCYYSQKNYESARLKLQRALLIDIKNQTYLQFYKQVEAALQLK